MIERPLQRVLHMIANEHVQMIVRCSCSTLAEVMQLPAQIRHTCNITISKGLVFFQKMEDRSPLQRPPQERKPELGFLGKAGDHCKIPTSPSKKMVFRFVPMVEAKVWCVFIYAW